MTTANVVFSGPATVVAPVYDEKPVASGQTIYPGMLVIEASGEYTVHATAGQGAGSIRVADVNFVKQDGVSTAYTVGDTCYAMYPRPGETYNVVLAASQTITKDEALTSDGAGAVRTAALDGTEEILFYADEAVTTTGSTGRIRARVAMSGFNKII